MRLIPWRRFLSLFGSFAGLALLVRQAILGWGSLPPLFESADALPWMAISLACAILAVGMPIFSFYCLLRGAGATVPPLQIVRRYTFSFLPRYIPGSVWGYVSRSEWLQQELAVPLAAANSASWFEVIASAATATVVAGGLFLPANNVVRTIYILVACIALLLLWGLSNQLPRTVNKIPAASWWRTWLPDRSVRPFWWIAAVGIYGLHWLLTGCALYYAVQAFGTIAVGGADPTPLLAVEIYAAAWLIGFVILIAPAGVGFRETALIGLMMSYAGIPFIAAAGIAVFFRLLLVIAELLWTTAGLFIREKLPVRSIP
jgi:hypothetical protein